MDFGSKYKELIDFTTLQNSGLNMLNYKYKVKFINFPFRKTSYSTSFLVPCRIQTQ